ncbi:MAG: hypothetical protein ACT4RN_07600, partial [Pseudonocardia sp.]
SRLALAVLAALAGVAWPAVEDRRATGAGWVLAAAAAGTAAATVVGGTELIDPRAYAFLALAFLVAARAPWSSAAAGLALATPVPLCLVLGVAPPGVVPLGLFATISLGPLLLIRLASAVRALEDTRSTLAERAVLVERLRVEDELRRTVGAELGSIVAQGRRAAGPPSGAARPPRSSGC